MSQEDPSLLESDEINNDVDRTSSEEINRSNSHLTVAAII